MHKTVPKYEYITVLFCFLILIFRIVKKEEGDKLEYVINNSNIESEEVEFCKKLDHDQLSSSQ